jgi:hypothetical protein
MKILSSFQVLLTLCPTKNLKDKRNWKTQLLDLGFPVPKYTSGSCWK